MAMGDIKISAKENTIGQPIIIAINARQQDIGLRAIGNKLYKNGKIVQSITVVSGDNDKNIVIEYKGNKASVVHCRHLTETEYNDLGEGYDIMYEMGVQGLKTHTARLERLTTAIDFVSCNDEWLYSKMGERFGVDIKIGMAIDNSYVIVEDLRKVFEHVLLKTNDGIIRPILSVPYSNKGKKNSKYFGYGIEGYVLGLCERGVFLYKGRIYNKYGKLIREMEPGERGVIGELSTKLSVKPYAFIGRVEDGKLILKDILQKYTWVFNLGFDLELPAVVQITENSSNNTINLQLPDSTEYVKAVRQDG